MKGKLITSHTEDGCSFASYQNKYGTFYGTAKTCPEDMSTFSSLAGEKYAAMRAQAEFAKFRYKQETIKLETIKNLIKDIDHDPKCASADADLKPIMRHIHLKLRDYTQSVSDWKNLYEYVEEEIANADELRQTILNRANKNK